MQRNLNPCHNPKPLLLGLVTFIYATCAPPSVPRGVCIPARASACLLPLPHALPAKTITPDASLILSRCATRSMAVQFFGETDEIRFGKLSRSLFTMFQVSFVLRASRRRQASGVGAGTSAAHDRPRQRSPCPCLAPTGQVAPPSALTSLPACLVLHAGTP